VLAGRDCFDSLLVLEHITAMGFSPCSSRVGSLSLRKWNCQPYIFASWSPQKLRHLSLLLSIFKTNMIYKETKTHHNICSLLTSLLVAFTITSVWRIAAVRVVPGADLSHDSKVFPPRIPQDYIQPSVHHNES
jgi:hypothetical protein